MVIEDFVSCCVIIFIKGFIFIIIIIIIIITVLAQKRLVDLLS
jgi:hypothetical protein